VNKTLRNIALASALALPMTSCYTFHHQVGDGGTGASEETERQWFILWGLVELNSVDSQEMAGGATDYTATTEWTPLDILINIFTGYITVYSRTYTVTK
jgi:hypothetical protein